MAVLPSAMHMLYMTCIFNVNITHIDEKVWLDNLPLTFNGEG